MKLRLPSSPLWYRRWLVRDHLRTLARSQKPILIGPFRSELGFEVLYWLPFVQWALKTYGIDPNRCLAVSRGGMGVFYPAKQQSDLYVLRSVDAVRVENQVDYETRKLQKQMDVTDWDRAVLRDAADAAGFRAYHSLHPWLMYWLFEPVWEERATLRHIHAHTRYEPLPVPNLPEGLTLPEKFVAVRFYERHTLPITHPEVRGILTRTVQNVASTLPVVLLNQPHVFADDHVDMPFSGDNIFTLPKVNPEQNFILQAGVLARASAFIGTYGGTAQWALRYGKPTLSFYAQFSGTAQAHRSLSQQLSAAMNVPFEMCDLRASKLWETALTKKVEAVAA